MKYLRILLIPSYSILATLSTLAALWVALWMFNFGVLTLVLGSAKIMVVDKLGFSLAVFQNLFVNLSPWLSLLLVLGVSIYGATIAIFVYLLRHHLPRE